MSIQGKIKKHNEKYKAMVEKQEYFLLENKQFVDSEGRLKFGLNKKDIVKKWKEF